MRKENKKEDIPVTVRRSKLQQAKDEALEKLNAATQQLEALENEERLQNLNAVAALMGQHNITVHDLAKFLGTRLASTRQPGNTRPKEKAPAKYFNPANPSEVWSGRGRAPQWAMPFLTSGDATRRVFKAAIHIKRP